MPNTPTRYSRAALGTTSATLYTIPTGVTAIVTEIIVVNTTASDINATVALAGVHLLSGAAVPGGGMLSIGIKQVMAATETITGFASSAGLNIFISGVNVT